MDKANISINQDEDNHEGDGLIKSIDVSGAEHATDGEPLQLVDIVNVNLEGSELTKLVLNKNSLKTVLETTKNRALCIISIVGPPRLGKSLLLNYIKYGLECIEKGNNDFSLSNMAEQNVSGFSWNSRLDSLTKGIWIWSRSFHIKDFAIILLDTQGFDEDSLSQHETYSILGLGFLLSSITIYNIVGDISSESLAPLFIFLKYGTTCNSILQSFSDETQFQKISILVRDWSEPSKYQYGRDGGNLRLQEKMRFLQSEQQYLMKTALCTCFQQVESFLMPRTGHLAFQKGFTGQIQNLNTDFCLHIETYLKNLLAENNIFEIKHFGLDVSSSDYLALWENHVSSFNTFIFNGNPANEEAVLHACFGPLHEHIIAIALKKHRQTVNSKIAACGYLTENELQQAHELGIRNSMHEFETGTQLPFSTKEHLEKIHSGLKDALENVKKWNSTCRSKFITECMNQAAHTYRECLNNIFRLNVVNSSSIDDFIQNQERIATFDALQESFKKKLCKENVNEQTALIDSLEQLFDTIFESYFETNMEGVDAKLTVERNRKLQAKNKERSQVESNLKSWKQSCLDIYNKEMRVARNVEDPLEEDGLICEHKKSFPKAMKMFKNLTIDVDKSLKKEHKGQLQSNINTSFSDILKDNRKTLEMLDLESQDLINEHLKEYQAAMRTRCEWHDDFLAQHSRVKETIAESFCSKWSFKGNHYKNSFHQKLQSEMEDLFAELSEIFTMQKGTDTDRLIAVEKDVRKHYHEEMEKHIHNHQFLDTETLNALHEGACRVAVAWGKNKFGLKSCHLHHLNEVLQQSFNKYDINNKLLNIEASRAVGIDLGTTYCCIAVYSNGKPTVIPNSEGKNTTPSYVSFDEAGIQSFGTIAKDNAFRYPEMTIFDTKRIIGRNENDEHLQGDIPFWPFLVLKGTDGPKIDIFGTQYPPEYFAAILLKNLVAVARKTLGFPIQNVVITVPAYFSDAQRAATIDAGEIAGLNVLQILDEPIAAALTYKIDVFHEDERKVLVFDLGGGTFDVAILATDAGKIQILNKDGDTHLGGNDFDKNLMKYCISKFKMEHNKDPLEGKNSDHKQEKDAARQRLRRLLTYCERAKIHLAAAPSTVISVEAFINGLDLKVEITRKTFEELNDVLFQRTIDIVKRSLKHINLSKFQIDDIVLVGGSTRIPKIQQMLSEFFDGKVLNHTIHPDEAVACGAAVQAAILNGEAVAQSLKIINIEDVVPMSLGIEATIDGKFCQFNPIILKGSKIPSKHNEIFVTSEDYQEDVAITIYQGDDPVAKENKLVGEFLLTGIPRAPAGREYIDVTMEVDALGILDIKAVCKSTGVKEGLTVNEKRSGRMSRETKLKFLKQIHGK